MYIIYSNRSYIYIYIHIYCICTYSRPDTGSAPEVGGLDLQSDQREHSGGSLDVLVVGDKSLL